MQIVPTIEVHQALHGYADGHRLLAASLSLDSESRRIIDSLSDASGTNLNSASNFFPYLTGYPLPDGKHYILAKTWLATDAMRPGTVWTHSLIIPFTDLAKLPSFVPLLKVFREPHSPPELLHYKKTLKVTITTAQQNSRLRSDLVKPVLSSLYGEPNDVVVIPSHEPQELEKLVLELWSQQWPRLRRQFSFCTGALEIRQLKGKPLDLQIVREGRASTYPQVFSLKKPFMSTPTGSWIDTLYQDLRDQDTDLRSFLNRFGAEVNGGRAVMAVLVTLFQLVQAVNEGRTPLIQLVRYMLTELDDAEGKHLRQVLLTSQAFGGLLSDNCEYSLLKIVGTWPQLEHLSAEGLQLAERSKALAQTKRHYPARLLRQLLRRGSQHRNTMVLNLLQNLPERELQLALWQNPSLLLEAIKLHPRLAHYDAVWRQPEHVQEKIFAHTTFIDDVSWWKSAVSAMLNAKSDVAADRLTQRFGNNLLPHVIDWYAAESKILPDAWKRQVSKASIIVLWLEEQHKPDLFKVQRVLTLSHPDKKSFHEVRADLWLDLAQRSNQKPHFLPLLTFILCLGFWNVGGRADALFGLCFGTVYRALEDGSLDLKPLHWLQPKLSPKPLLWLGEYSTKLAFGRAIAHSMAHHKINPESFLSYLNQQERKWFIEAAESDRGTHRWLRKSVEDE
jgi:hypothetical protein